MFSLVRRLCSRIIVVDAEHDPEYRFNSYFKLQAALKRELGVEFIVDKIEKTRGAARWCRYASVDSGCVEGKNGSDMKAQEQGTRSWERKQGSKFYEDPTSVMTGVIRGFPEISGKEKHIQVIYIKLSLNPEKISEYPRKAVQEYYATSSRKRINPGLPPSGCLETYSYLRLLVFGCVFPQEATTDQAFTKHQFDAYRKLGDFITCRAHKEIQEFLGVGITDTMQCPT